MVKIIELKLQSSAIKILADTLNSLLTDVNITFYPTQDTNNSDDLNTRMIVNHLMQILKKIIMRRKLLKKGE